MTAQQNKAIGTKKKKKIKTKIRVIKIFSAFFKDIVRCILL